MTVRFRPPIRRWPLAAAWLAAALLATLVFGAVRVRSDLADLLPAGGTPASRMMLQELRAGPASSLILVGIENAAPEPLAAISRALSTSLQQDRLFRLADNGAQLLTAADQERLFQDRYLLSPAISADAFRTAPLRRDFQILLKGLQSSAAPLVQALGLPDPTGAFPAMLATWAGDSEVRTVGGVWFAADRNRALLLAQTAANGLDLTAEDAALAAITRDFETARAGIPKAAAARLLVSGPAVFAHDAAHAIRADVRRLSSASSLLVVALLFWRFRSLWVVAAIAIPLLLAAAAGALAVQLGFGFVHGITLGFGITMLGVAVDYPVLLIGHRKQAEPAFGTLRRIGPAFDLAVVTATLGLTGMAFSGFPGLSQLGVFSIAGILTAAATTRFLLPGLIVAAGLAPASAGNPALLARIEPLRRWRLAAVLPVAAAVVVLATRGPTWDRDLAHLSPMPPDALALDAELRAELGAAEIGQVLVVQGGTAEAVLQHEEDLQPTIERLTHAQVIAGAEFAAHLLPSARTQRARQSLLPDAATLGVRVADAAWGLGFTKSAFQAFIADIAAARALPPIGPAELPGRLPAARLGALLFARDGAWFGVIAPRAVRDPARLAAAFAGQNGVTYVDVHAETGRVVDGYTRQAWPWLAGGAAAAIVALAVGTRDAMRLLRVLGSITAALLVTIAALTLAGSRFSLIHLVALQFVAGIGLDYALFFSRENLDPEERSRTLRTLVTCNAMALLSFGLLALCRTPLLRDIGVTVATGVVAAMVFAFFFAGPLPGREIDPA